MDYKIAFERTAQSKALSDKALRECQKLLCPQWGDCADSLKDDEECACGFKGGPFANSVPKNREAEALRSLLERCRTILGNMAAENEGGYFTPRWQISDEPLRADAKNLLPEIDALLSAHQ